jgi:hypothetical protein
VIKIQHDGNGHTLESRIRGIPSYEMSDNPAYKKILDIKETINENKDQVMDFFDQK